MLQFAKTTWRFHARRLVIGLLAVCALLFGPGRPGHAAVDDPDVLRVALYEDYLPLSGTNISGFPSGMLPEIWRLWSEKTGVPVTFVMGTFAESIEALREDRADVHAGLFRSPERSEWLSYTRTLSETASYFHFWRDRGAPQTLAAYGGLPIGVLRGTYQENVLRSSPLEFQVRAFDNVDTMLRALARGSITAVLHEGISMDAVIARAGISGDVIRLPIEVLRNSAHAAVRKDRPAIKALVDYGLAQITRAEYADIEKRWIEDDALHFFKAQGQSVPLNSEEKAWLKTKPRISIGLERDWPPMSHMMVDGKVAGMSPAIAELVARKLGVSVQFVAGEWQWMLDEMKADRLDVMVDISATRSRTPYIHFTSPYLSIPHVIAGRTDDDSIEGIESLANKTLALERGFATVEYIHETYPDITVIEFESTLEALQAVASGRADAWAGNQAILTYLKDERGGDLDTVESKRPFLGRSSSLRFGVSGDQPILRDIIEKTLAGIDPAAIAEITDPWLRGTIGGIVELSPAEQRWLGAHRDEPVRVFVGSWPPFHYMKDGAPRGLGLDFVRYALELLGLEMEPVPTTWSDAFEGISNFESVDILPTIAPSPERAKRVAMTRTYLEFPSVIFTREDAGIIAGLDGLRGHLVAVERGFIMSERLKRDFPDIKVLDVDDTAAALEAVSLGRADAYVGNLAAGTFQIEALGLTNLKIAAPTEYANDSQAMGVRRDWPELASMLDKVLSQMSDEVRRNLTGSALAVRFEHGADIKLILTYAIPLLGVILVIVAVIAYSNRKLAKEVAERKAAELRIREREAWFKSLLESAPDATVIVNPAGEIVMANKQAELMFGADRSRLIGEKIELLVPDDIRPRHVAYRDGFVTSSAPRAMGANMQLRARKLDGEEFPVEISLSPIETAEGTLIAASVRNVTERRAAEAKLHQKDIQLTAALENMSGGMFMIDKDLVIRVFNRKFVDLYKLPDVHVGTPLRDVMWVRAQRGDYGPGDIETLVDERIETYRIQEFAMVEDRLTDGTIIESFRQPIEDGGIVCVFNDVTIRKKAEEALAHQTKQLQNLSQKLSRYLSPQIYEAIFAGAADASISTARKKLTVFFSDIKNFTATTEEMEPEDMTFLLNDYLTKMTEIALEHGGTIDKYVGDAILVFFGDPDTLGVKEDALQAVRMAVAMQRRMVDLRAKWADMGFKYPFHIRCGINTGYCNVGNFGSEQRIDYTIIGGQVNLAARLESICEPDGVTVAYETYSLVRDEFDAEPLEPIQVKGIREPVHPYAISGLFDGWDPTERYIRRDDVRGLRLWVDLMRMSKEQREDSIKELEEAIEIIRQRTEEDDA